MTERLRIAVYGIAKDEGANVLEWAESTVNADDLLLVDTGSTDDTLYQAGQADIPYAQITVEPFRFDDARNAALSLVTPVADYCIALDLDERLQPGWRDALEKAIADGITRPLYRYVWNWTPDGGEGQVFLAEKVHRRFGYRWHHPVHEVLRMADPMGREIRDEAVGMAIHHHGDPAKDRSSYLQLLELAVAEDPTDDRNVHYLAREYLFNGLWAKAEDTFNRHLKMPRALWHAERSASMRYLGDVVWLRRHNLPGGPLEVEQWYLRACAEAPGYREPWYALMKHYQRTGRSELAWAAALRGCEVTERRLDYVTTPEPWDGTMETVASGENLDPIIGSQH